MEANGNENTTAFISTFEMQQRWSVMREKYLAIQVFHKKPEKSQIHNLTLYQKELEKEEQIKPKAGRMEIIKD